MPNLKTQEGRMHGARYYTVEPPMRWELDADDWGGINTWEQMTHWCQTTFGPTPDDGVWTAGARWYANSAKFWFRKEEDFTLFLLRWS